VVAIAEGDFLCTETGQLQNDGTGAGLFGDEYPPENLLFYGGPPRRTRPLARGLKVISTLSSQICSNDVALVILDRAISLPSFEIRLDAPVTSDERITVIGYGPTPDKNLLPETALRQRRRGIIVDTVGADSSQDVFSGVAPRSFTTGGAYACYGDSGAPALAELDGRLVGVYSTQQGSGCVAGDVVNHFVHLPPYRTLIEEAFVAAGQPPPGATDSGVGGAEGGAGGSGGDATSDSGAVGGGGALDAGGAAGSATSGAGTGDDSAGQAGSASAPEQSPASASAASGCALSQGPASSLPSGIVLGMLVAGAARRRRRSN
jgi:hypothetical protein